MSLKMYVLIKDSLSAADQAVQAGHALAQFGLDHPDSFRMWQRTSNTLIYLSVKNIKYWEEVLEDGRFQYSVFNEPDMYDLWETEPGLDTAIAVAPNWMCQYLLFKDLPLAFQPKPKESEPAPISSCNPPLPEPKRRRWWQP